MDGRIEQIRRAIDNAVDEIISRMGTYDIDLAKIGDAELNVELKNEYDPCRRVEVTDVYIISDNERRYENVEGMIRERLEEAASDMNREMEADYVERLTARGKRDYYANIA